MNENDTDNDDTERACWLAETGKPYESADRERLALTEEKAQEIVDEWRSELNGQDDRWFGVTRMYATVWETEDP